MDEKIIAIDNLQHVLEEAHYDSFLYRKYGYTQEVIARFHPDGELAYYKSELFKLLSQPKLPYMILGFLNDNCEAEITIPMLIDFYVKKFHPGSDVNIYSESEKFLQETYKDATIGFAIYHDFLWLNQHINADKPPRFDFGFKEEIIRNLFKKLIEKRYIEKDTNLDSFLWAFGHVIPPALFQPIGWIKTSSALGDLLLALQQKKEKDSLLPHKTLQRKTADIASSIFIKNSSPVKISKRNRESGLFGYIKDIVDEC